jgi:hypothetical protein
MFYICVSKFIFTYLNIDKKLKAKTNMIFGMDGVLLYHFIR